MIELASFGSTITDRSTPMDVAMPIPLRNTRYTYGLVSVAFHWIVAIAFLANYALIYYREWFSEPKSDAARSLLSTHTAIGVSVLVFVALRILWRVTERAPADVPGSRFEHLASRGAHIALYAIMVFLPLTGYLGTGGPSQLFFAVELPSFRDTVLFATVIEGWMSMTWETFENAMDTLHKSGGAYVVSALIGLHVTAALYHHLVRRDIVLTRMTAPSRVPEDPSLVQE